MSDRIKVKSLKEGKIEKHYFFPNRRELRQTLIEMGFLPPDAEEMVGPFAMTAEGKLAFYYEIFSLNQRRQRKRLVYHLGSFLVEEEDKTFYANVKTQDKLPISIFSPKRALQSDTVVLTAGMENYLAVYAMTEKSHVAAVPHAGFALKNPTVLSWLFKDEEIRRVVLAFPKSQKQYQKELAQVLKKRGFQVETLDYEGESPYEHYQLSVNRMLEQAMEQLDVVSPDNGV